MIAKCYRASRKKYYLNIMCPITFLRSSARQHMYEKNILSISHWKMSWGWEAKNWDANKTSAFRPGTEETVVSCRINFCFLMEPSRPEVLCTRDHTVTNHVAVMFLHPFQLSPRIWLKQGNQIHIGCSFLSEKSASFTWQASLPEYIIDRLIYTHSKSFSAHGHKVDHLLPLWWPPVFIFQFISDDSRLVLSSQVCSRNKALCSVP